MSTKLSPTMSAAVARAKEHGGRLIRLKGGFWTVRDIALDERGVPIWWVAAGTVNALVARGVMEWSDWKANRCGSFAIEARVR